MIRLQSLQRVSFRHTTRAFSSSTGVLQNHSRLNLDTNGRTPGFARRRRSGAVASQQNEHRNASSQVPNDPQDKVASALQAASTNDVNQLSAPVHLPEDRYGILQPGHPAMSILANSSIVVQRQLEMMNVFLGFEQANKYVLMDSSGNSIGYLAEQEHGMGNAMARQAFRTHRSFTTHVFDKDEREVLRFHRPFSWISSRIKVYDATASQDTEYSNSTALQDTSLGSIANQSSAQVSSLRTSDMRVVGEAQQQWAPLRRKYNLFLSRPTSVETSGETGGAAQRRSDPQSTALQTVEPSMEELGFTQFAYVDEPFLSWDFSLLSESGQLIGSVNRNFAGFGREIFTDTGVYALRMDAASLAEEPRHLISQSGTTSQPEGAPGMTLDQRAIILATAVSIDFDYFSRHSHAGVGGGWMPLWMPWGGAGGEAAAGGAAAGEAGAAGAGAGAVGGAAEAGAAEGGAAAATRAAQEGARNVGAGEGAFAGAGSLAGYEAMHRARESRSAGDDASPQTQQDGFAPEQEQQRADQDGGAWSAGGLDPRDVDRHGGSSDDGWRGGSSSSSSGGGDGGDVGGDGGGIDLDDFF